MSRREYLKITRALMEATKIPGIPKVKDLPSLQKRNPTPMELYNDEQKLIPFRQHPAILHVWPSYEEAQNNYIGALWKAYFNLTRKCYPMGKQPKGQE